VWSVEAGHMSFVARSVKTHQLVRNGNAFSHEFSIDI
jgi:hypothetical protein